MDLDNKIDIRNNAHMEAVKKRIIKNEGRRNTVYRDTEGYLTVGIGYKLPKNSGLKEHDYVDDSFIEDKFNMSFKTALNGAYKLVEGHNVKPEAFGVLVEMIYQMGASNVAQWTKTLNHIRNGEYYKASNEMLTGSKEGTPSKWSLQTPARAFELAQIMGNLEDNK